MKEIKILKINNENYPQKLLKIKNPPDKLYVLGDETLLNKPSIAIIGSRDCTEYGYNQAKRFATEISRQNICIISGMAIGIDSAAHIGAKDQIGKTIAVLGGGFYNIFPKQNEELFYEILKSGGCIVTEYAPNIKPEGKNFPKRNRIVSGLSNGVLVVEAKFRSGTSITAKFAKKQAKTVFCIPSNIDSKNGKGTASLIQNGAKLVLTADEILKTIGISKEKTIQYENSRKTKIKIEKEYKKVYEVLKKMPTNINEICKMSGKNIMEVNSILTMLEIKGVVKKSGVNEFIKI